MSKIAFLVGQRIRGYRLKAGLSQEKLAELSGCHMSYIGQLERGEKNATLESVEKIAGALGVSLSTLFENIEAFSSQSSIPVSCYEFLLTKSPSEQLALYSLLQQIDEYKNLK